jgi:hypothetical protein
LTYGKALGGAIGEQGRREVFDRVNERLSGCGRSTIAFTPATAEKQQPNADKKEL